MGGHGSGKKPTKFQAVVGGRVREPVMLNDDGRLLWELINRHCGTWLGELDSPMVQAAIEAWENLRIVCRLHEKVIHAVEVDIVNLARVKKLVREYETSWFNYERKLGLSPLSRVGLPPAGKDADADHEMTSLLGDER